jgi:hypothetical protein
MPLEPSETSATPYLEIALARTITADEAATFAKMVTTITRHARVSHT